MSTTSLLYATSVADNSGIGTVTWSGASNAVGNNTVDATRASAVLSGIGTQSHYLIGTISHGLTASDTFNGIAIAFRRYSTLNDSDPPHDNAIRLVKDGTVTGNNKSASASWPQTGAWSSDYGSSSDLWGISSFTGANTLGIAVSVMSSDPNDTAYITAFRATITYTTAAGKKFRRVVSSRIGSRSCVS